MPNPATYKPARKAAASPSPAAASAKKSAPAAKKSPAPAAKKSAPAAASKPAATKAARTVAAGGGPEDPVTDTIAAGQYLKQRRTEKKQAKTDARRKSRGGQKVTVGGKEVPSAPNLGKVIPSGNPRRLLLLEFAICFVILGAGTVVAPSGSQDGVPRMAVKGSGLAALFLILSLVASGGQTAAKAAAGLGGLVTLAYVVTSSDAANIVSWISGFYSHSGLAAGSAGQGLAAGAVAPGPTGVLPGQAEA
jgi:hypothetical protein